MGRKNSIMKKIKDEGVIKIRTPLEQQHQLSV